MVDEEPSTRTLPSGEVVFQYSDGREVLQPTNSLASVLDDQAAEQETASAELRDALIEAATVKREAMADGNSVPPDKRVV